MRCLVADGLDDVEILVGGAECQAGGRPNATRRPSPRDHVELAVAHRRRPDHSGSRAPPAQPLCGLRGSVGGLFTTASELRDDAEQAGFTSLGLFNVEGPGFVVGDFAERWSDRARRQALVHAARLVEEDPDMLAVASHLLLVGRR